MNRLCSLILLFFLLLSNTANLIAAVPCLFKQNVWNISEISVGSQCKMFADMPENFVNICIEVSNDLKAFGSYTDREESFKQDKGIFFADSQFAVICKTVRKNISYLLRIADFNNDCNRKDFIAYGFIFLLFLFYLIRYIGLLKLFNSQYQTNYLYCKTLSA